MTNDPRHAARRTHLDQEVRNADPAHLLIMMYDRAIAAVSCAGRTMMESDASSVEIVHHELIRAQDIVMEHMLSLDHDRDIAIASNLEAVYGFCLETLTRANLDKDPTCLGVVGRSLGELREAFASAARSVAVGAP